MYLERCMHRYLSVLYSRAMKVFLSSGIIEKSEEKQYKEYI